MESNANEIANALTIVDPDGGKQFQYFFQGNPFTCSSRICFPQNDIIHAYHKLVLWEWEYKNNTIEAALGNKGKK